MLEFLDWKIESDHDEYGNRLMSRLWINVPTMMKIDHDMFSGIWRGAFSERLTLNLGFFAEGARTIAFLPYFTKLRDGENAADIYTDGVIAVIGEGTESKSMFIGGGEWVGFSVFWEYFDMVREDEPNLEEKKISWFG